jgi:hypothetical protein
MSTMRNYNFNIVLFQIMISSYDDAFSSIQNFKLIFARKQTRVPQACECGCNCCFTTRWIITDLHVLLTTFEFVSLFQLPLPESIWGYPPINKPNANDRDQKPMYGLKCSHVCCVYCFLLHSDYSWRGYRLTRPQRTVPLLHHADRIFSAFPNLYSFVYLKTLYEINII